MNTNILTQIYNSPCGSLLLGDYGGRLCLADWPGHAATGRVCRLLDAESRPGSSRLLDAAACALDAWFAGDSAALVDVPLLPVGTEFRQEVWTALMKIPYGHTITYGELAVRLGRRDAVRAVASAVGANALSIFIPCHRVVASAGLGGYAGGVDAKRILLSIEAK